MTQPNTVLVATTVSSTATSTVGALIVLDGKTGIPVTDATDLSGVDSIQFGVVKEAAVSTGALSQRHPAYIAKTKAFTKEELKNIVASDFSAETEDTFTITFTGTIPTNITDGDNLHVKMTYKVEGHAVNKSEGYVFDLNQYTSTTTLATDVAAAINANPQSWVTATSSNAVVTVTAKRAIDYQPTAKSINSTFKFNQVEFDLASFRVNGTSPYYAFGTVAKTVNAGAGVGNPYVVRDQEKDAMGYLGAMFSPAYPNLQPASSVATVGGLVDESAEYNCISFTAELKYRAADQGYMKSTPVSAQMYYITSVGNNVAATEILNSVKEWAGFAA